MTVVGRHMWAIISTVDAKRELLAMAKFLVLFSPFYFAVLRHETSIYFVSSGLQIPFELGLEIDRPLGYFVVPLTVVEIFRHITETNVCALIVSIISIAFLVTIKVNNSNCEFDEAYN